MGEIGINRNVFLYQLKYWEIVSIIKGYRRRSREQWEMARNIGATVCNLFGVKITAKEYIPLPWDEHSSRDITEEEARELVEMMRRENEELMKNQQEGKI